MDCFCRARSAAECKLVDCITFPDGWRIEGPRPTGWVFSLTKRVRRRTTSIRADAATNITTLAAKPAGTHGFSSPCSIHQSTKNKAAEAAAAAVIKPDADAGRSGPRGFANADCRRTRARLDGE